MIDHSALQAAEEFRRRHPGSRCTPGTILRAVRRGHEDGNIVSNYRDRPGPPALARNPRNEQRILDYVEAHPRASIREMSRILNLTYSTIQQLLRDEGYYYNYI